MTKEKETKKITLGLVVSWILGVLFGLNALGFLFIGKFSAGIPILLAALVLLPPVNRLVKEKFNFELSRGLKITIVIVLFIIYIVNLTSDAVSPSVPSPTALEEPKTTEIPMKIYSMNEDVDVDYMTYKVTKAETFTEMGTSFLKKETTGKFIKIYLDVTNNARETKQIFTPRFTLIDQKGRRYDRIADDMLYIADALELGKQVQPGLTTSGAVVFELPTDSQDLVLSIRGDWLSVSEVKVAISTVRNTGKDTTLKEEQSAVIDETMRDAQRQIGDLLGQSS